MGGVVVVGSINTDLLIRVPRFPAAGETIAASSLERLGGGKGANQAIAAARLGAEVRLVGAVGTDPDSQVRLDDLRAEGIDLSGVLSVPGSGGLALVEVEESSGDNRITIVASANSSLVEVQVVEALTGQLSPTDVVCCQLEVPLPAVLAALRLSRSTGARTLLNAAPARADLAPLLPLTDVLVVNEVEAGQLLGGEPITPEGAAEVAGQLAALGAPSVVITLGAAGACVRTPADTLYVQAPVVPVVDTAGAGDALVGALAAGLAAGSSLKDVVRTGVLAGSFAVQRYGAQPSFPKRSELNRWSASLT